jgi:hypothetical protein
MRVASHPITPNAISNVILINMCNSCSGSGTLPDLSHTKHGTFKSVCSYNEVKNALRKVEAAARFDCFEIRPDLSHKMSRHE